MTDGCHHAGCEQEQAVQARHQVDAGRHHRRRVDERADGRRARHRVGQPDLQRQLARLANGAGEHEGGGERGDG
jgi:hypothetical protein